LDRPRLGFVGAGVVGTVMAKALARGGYEVVAVTSRSPARRDALADALPNRPAVRVPQAVADLADLVFLTVSDDAIVPVAEGIRWRPGTCAVHASGVAGAELLASVRAQRVDAGVFHPLQTFATADQAERNLPGSTIGIEASSGPWLEALRAMANAVGGTPRVISGDRAIYHASAVFASNYLVALLDAASSLWAQLGLSREDGLESLLPLVRGTLENLASVGLPDALTGPIARGDVGPIERHIAALRSVAPDLLPLYKQLALRAIPIARAKGRLSQETAARIATILDRADEGGCP